MTAAISKDRVRGRFPVTLSPCHLVTLSLFLAVGCDWHIAKEPPERPVPPETVLDFGQLYDWHCAGCHGPDGKLGPAPPLDDAVFLTIVPDEELQMVVAAGRKGTLMPAWAPENGGSAKDKRAKARNGGSAKDKQIEVRNGGSLTVEQVEALAGGIKKHWSGLAKPEGEIPSYSAPEGKAGGDKEAGAKVFAAACASCHGERGKGGEKKDGEKVGAVNDPAFLALISDQELRRIIITGRPDLGMPGYGPAAGRSADFKPLTNADVGNLVALLASWRDGPPPGG